MDLDQVYAVEADGEVRSTARIVSLGVYVDGGVVSMGGIATVATHPTYRRRGLAESLTRGALYDLPLRWAAIPSPARLGPSSTRGRDRRATRSTIMPYLYGVAGDFGEVMSVNAIDSLFPEPQRTGTSL